MAENESTREMIRIIEQRRECSAPDRHKYRRDDKYQDRGGEYALAEFGGH